MTAVLLSTVSHSVYAARKDQIPKQAGTSPVKVFILAGQSNMEGQGVADLDGKTTTAAKAR